MNSHRKSKGTSAQSAIFNRGVKTVATHFFKGVRWVARRGASTPHHLATLKRDIVEAWKESARC